MTALATTAPSSSSRSGAGKALVIGLINCMPDAALKPTERQFRTLLATSSRFCPVVLRLFTIPEVARGSECKSHIQHHYEDLKDLWSSHLDAMIVTGTEPRAEKLSDEPYWPTMVRLIDWAERCTASCIWSCLAAHAVALHLDCISRQRSPTKLSGVFECRKAGEHAITDGLGERWFVPHSRYNGLPEDLLHAAGYRLLSRSELAGADTCVKHRKSLFILMQGHPEYSAHSLYREYRRDVGRYLQRERDDYPDLPCNYFSGPATTRFVAFRNMADQRRDAALMSIFPELEGQFGTYCPWRGASLTMYSNWLKYLREHARENRSRSLRSS